MRGGELKILENLRNLAENQVVDRWWQGEKLQLEYRENIGKINFEKLEKSGEIFKKPIDKGAAEVDIKYEIFFGRWILSNQRNLVKFEMYLIGERD